MESRPEWSYGAVLSYLSGLREALETPGKLTLEDVQRNEVRRLLSECTMAVGGRSGSEPAAGAESGSAATAAQAPTSPRRPRTQPDPRLGDIKILIVDDEEVTARLLSRQLGSLHINSDWVLSGEDALNRLYSSPNEYHLVLCDVNMPGLSGSEVLIRVLEDERIKNIPIVMVSTDGDLEKAKELVGAGAKDYIMKPVSNISLLSMSLKVDAWRREQSHQHLSAVYNITSGLLVHVKLLLAPVDGEPLPTLAGDKAAPLEEDMEGLVAQNVIASLAASKVRVVKAIVQEASQPMRHLIGVTKQDIEAGRVDILDYITPEEDRNTLRTQLKESLYLEERPHERKVVWRWLDRKHHGLPVVGSWIRVGSPMDRQMLIESSSLLPSMMLQREKEKRASADERRHQAERRRQNAVELAQRALNESNRLKQEMVVTKRTGVNVRDELTSMLGEMSVFSNMLMANPKVLTWRIRVETGVIDFVSPSSCMEILHYSDQDLLGRKNEDLIHPEDREKAASAFKNISETVRIRRITKENKQVWVESRAYSWWDDACTILIVTEYDISPFRSSSSLPPVLPPTAPLTAASQN